MPRKATLTVTAERTAFCDKLVYVTTPETHSTLLRVPRGTGTFEGTVEILVVDTERYPEGSNPPLEAHTLHPTWPSDRLVVESSAGLSQREIRAMFPELYASDDEYARLPTPAVSGVARQLDATAAEGPIGVWQPVGEACPWCATPLRAVLDLDLADERLAVLGVDGRRLRVVTCSGCVCFGPIYAEVDVLGAATWSGTTQRPSYLPPSGRWGELVPSRAVPTDEILQPDDRDEALAAEPVAGGESHLGGRPRWVQCWEYPTCPTCSQPMPFLGQVDLGDPPWQSEGTYFVFVDLRCGLACTLYQQT